MNLLTLRGKNNSVIIVLRMEASAMTKLEEAIVFATNAHAGVKRKGSDAPYILHPIEAMMIVASMTDDEEVMAAAVLHDTVEDTHVTLKDIKERFGQRIAELVASESENKREDQPPEETWVIRKQESIEHLRTASHEAKMICLGDKLSNLRQMARDYKLFEENIWKRFNQKDKMMHAWYYDSLFSILREEFPNAPATAEYAKLFFDVFWDYRYD